MGKIIFFDLLSQLPVLGEIYRPPPKWQLRKLCHDDDSLAQEHFVLNVRTFDDRPQPVPAGVSDKGLLHNKNLLV